MSCVQTPSGAAGCQEQSGAVLKMLGRAARRQVARCSRVQGVPAGCRACRQVARLRQMQQVQICLPADSKVLSVCSGFIDFKLPAYCRKHLRMILWQYARSFSSEQFSAFLGQDSSVT
ncbi:unnamed protein product [Symbiodinium sp. CCMP2592]|nr:unnamed protein product [Symbiodinium sp. CCMP2592]